VKSEENTLTNRKKLIMKREQFKNLRDSLMGC